MAEREWSAGDKLMVQDWLDLKWHKAQVLDVAKEYIKVSQLPLRHALAIFVSPTSRAQPDNSKYFGRGSGLDEWINTPSSRLAALVLNGASTFCDASDKSTCHCCTRTFTSKHALSIHIGLNKHCKAALNSPRAVHRHASAESGGKGSIDKFDSNLQPLESNHSSGSKQGSLHERESKRDSRGMKIRCKDDQGTLAG